MKISKELRQELMDFLQQLSYKNFDDGDEDKASRLRRQLEYKKVGRKVGWRKERQNPLNTEEGVIEQAYREHTGGI